MDYWRALEILGIDDDDGLTRTKLRRTYLRKLKDHPLVGDTRAVGLIGALELVADKETRRAFGPKQGIGAACSDILQEQGLIVRAMGGEADRPPVAVVRVIVDTAHMPLARLATVSGIQ